MLEQFLRHINQHKLFEPSDAVLLALSGGLDSMVMLHLFIEARFTVAVAHCNFGLRGDESDGDEALVDKFCNAHGIPIYKKQFKTQAFADERGLSIQMAARELRYDFFNEVLIQYKYKYVATAHHLNDSIETVFLNLIRGTGIEGLSGISIKNNAIIRPLLFATREEIKAYADVCKLPWRKDSSNASEKYDRNLLRNRIIPLLKKINPGIEHSFKNTLERLKGTADLQRQTLDEFKKNAVRDSGDKICINKQLLLLQRYPEVVLWELIKERDFNLDQCRDIVAPHHQAGKVFYGGKYILTIDRLDLIIHTQQMVEDSQIHLTAETRKATLGSLHIQVEFGDIQNFTLRKDSQLAQLDLDLIRFPLIWRKWREGDHFVPLGMKQRKKISDFLIDLKVPLSEKQNITVLLSDEEIIWVAGLRIGERFKITDQTKRFLLIQYDVGGLENVK